MKHHHRRLIVRAAGAVLLAGATTLALPHDAAAQGSLRDQTRAARAEGSGPAHIISFNPFLPLFGYFQGEYEQRIKSNVAFALSGSYMKLDDYYTNLDAKIRLYPQERALQGLGVAAGLGYGAVRLDEDICDDVTCRNNDHTESAPTFSVEGQYQWLLGSSQATAVTIGAGVKRYFIPGERAHGIERVVPTMRLTIGYAF